MSVRRRPLLAAGMALLGLSQGATAQGPTVRGARIGFLGATTRAGYARNVEALLMGLRTLGYVEGKNFALEFRWAEGRYERLAELAADLTRLNPDVLVTHGTPATREAKRATNAIPIVMAVVADPVAAGLVASFAHPGTNVTGSAYFAAELSSKRLELILEARPRITRLAALVNPENPTFVEPMIRAMQSTATALNIRLQPFEARGPRDFEGAIAAMARGGTEVLAVLEEATLNSYPMEIADLAKKHGIPSVGNKEYAQAGGLIGYGVNIPALFRRSAYFVDKILKGAKPADLPVEQPTKFELVINLKTAKALGLTIPRSLLLRADEVIQ